MTDVHRFISEKTIENVHAILFSEPQGFVGENDRYYNLNQNRGGVSPGIPIVIQLKPVSQ